MCSFASPHCLLSYLQLNGTSPPVPFRGTSQDGSTDNDGGEDDAVDSRQAGPINVQDLVPRVNISEQLTSNLFSELADKNWKVRCTDP